MSMDDVPPGLPANPTRFVDQFRACMRSRNMACKTEKTYVTWVVRFIRFHRMRHPGEMAEKEVEAFLSNLAIQRNVAPATQKTALCALVFLCGVFLNKPLRDMQITRSKRNVRVPEVFSHDEAKAVIEQLSDVYRIMALLMYGTGLRINECLRLRVKDVNFSMGYIVVREGKGAKDRRTLLPESLKEPLQNYRDTQHSSQLFIIGIRVGTNYVPTLPGWIPACAGMTVVLGLSKCHSGRIRGYTPSRAAAPGHPSSRGISESVHVAGKAGQSPRE